MSMPNFPIELWVLNIFKDIEDFVCRFVYFDENSLKWKGGWVDLFILMEKSMWVDLPKIS